MRKRILKLMTIFMIVLMLSIPVIIADSTASITSYAGQDNVQSYIRTFDDYLEVSAEITPELDENSTFTNFTVNNVFIEILGSEDVFDSCEASGDVYTCTYTTSQTDRQGASKNFVVNVYDDDGTEVVSEEAIFYIDEEAPEITDFSYPTYFTGDTNITIAVEDTACPTCTDACAGIETIDLTFADEVKATIDVGSASDEESTCSYEEVIETSVTELLLDEGSQTFCLVATDRTQNEDDKCTTIVVDTQGPSMASSSFVIKDNDNNAVEHISVSTIAATVSVNITEEGSGLDEETVYADLSDLNYLNGDNYEESRGNCDEVDDGLYTCTWDITIELLDSDGNPQFDSITVDIVAIDNAGNEGELAKSLSFVEDTTNPIVLNIIGTYGEYLNAQNNSLTMEIQEEGSGFDDLNVYLDLTEASLGQVQADSCEDGGSMWYCYWDALILPSSLAHGKQIDLAPGTIIDDAGNSYETETSIEDVTFVYDEEGPEFINVTIAALGREADVITEGDVVAITAYITDDVSGVDENNVYADYSDFDRSNDRASADYCAEISSDLWECYWEYIGSLDAGDSIELNIIAYDEAGNEKDSDDDNAVGKIHVVGTLDAAGDFWAEEVDVETPPMLNPNFLYFSSTGTMVRFDTELVSTGSIPYVHSFQYDSCQAATDLAGAVTGKEWLDASIVGQYYYDEGDRTSKYVLVQIPAFFYGQANATVDEGSFVEVNCIGSITQAGSEYSDIYGEDESINLTVSVPLYAGLYAEPSLTNVDKIQKAQKFLDTLDKITKFLGIWSEWGQKICGPLNGVRVIANNMLTMLKAVNTLTMGEATGAVAGMVKVTNFLNEMWYGARNADQYTKLKTEVGDTGVKEIAYTKDMGFLKNKYRFPSLGYICDTVLCESCSESWNSLFSGWKDKGTSEDDMPSGMYLGGEWTDNLIGSGITWPFNPRENIVIALVCNPPCVPGIYAQLNMYKEIYVAYNVCLNIATMKGEDIVQCDQFLAAQICQNIVNAFFWHWFWGGITTALSKAAVNLVIDKAIKENVSCPSLTDNESPSPACSTYRGVVALVTLAVTGVDTYNTVKNLFSFENGLFGNKTTEENVEELEDQTEEDIGEQLGTTPSY
jgi:hypothetical protein